MQLVNKERQRKIRKELQTGIPKAGSLERELWEQNQQKSPLLQLPGEIRNRIYNLVLDVGQINVCYKRWEHRQRSRSNGQKYYETLVEGGFFCRVLDRRQDPWKVPSQPGSSKQHGMTLLSGVCRQLYTETAALPFSLNVWSFESIQIMERLVLKEKRLPRMERRAIRMIYAETIPHAALDKAFGSLDVLLLRGGIRMTRKVDPDQMSSSPNRRSNQWEISHHWWPKVKKQARGDATAKGADGA